MRHLRIAQWTERRFAILPAILLGASGTRAIATLRSAPVTRQLVSPVLFRQMLGRGEPQVLCARSASAAPGPADLLNQAGLHKVRINCIGDCHQIVGFATLDSLGRAKQPTRLARVPVGCGAPKPRGRAQCLPAWQHLSCCVGKSLFLSPHRTNRNDWQFHSTLTIMPKTRQDSYAVRRAINCKVR